MQHIDRYCGVYCYLYICGVVGYRLLLGGSAVTYPQGYA